MEDAKKVRTQCLKNFTRNVNSYTNAETNELPLDLLAGAFEKVRLSFEKLEAAQDAYVVLVDDEAEGDYLDEPADRYQKVLVAFGGQKKQSMVDERAFQQKQVEETQKAADVRRAKEIEEAKVAALAKSQEEKEEFYNANCAEFEMPVANFKISNESIQEVVKDASDADKRESLGKLEKDFLEIKKKLVALRGVDPLKDTALHQNSFFDDVQKPFETTQQWFLAQLKNSAIVPSPSTSSSSSLPSNTKKEAVTLPSFQGDLSLSPSPYLTYPVWLNRWNSLISEYEEKWHIHFLLDRIDEEAREKIVGCEQDYKGAMKRLDSFYGDPLKVVSCVMTEVNTPSAICEGDYLGLVSYCGVLENNYNRLSNMNLGHEMSNTSSMSSILRKFPNSVSEKWAEFFVQQQNDVKAKPFPTFVKWLISQKKIWEHVASVETTRDGALMSSFYAGGNDNPNPPSSSGVTCFKCGKTGHKRKDCPESKPKPNKNNRPKRPQFKKFWCALHKDDPSKNCSSVMCEELRKTDPTKRIQLLMDNKDCDHCMGDHDPGSCNRKDRICGGGKVNRGCSKKHAGHELFCISAKVFAVQRVFTVQGQRRVEGVLLLIANIRSCQKNETVTVFFDLGSTSNFVREAYAQRMKFKCRQELLCVTTLTGTVTDYTVMTYSCSKIIVFTISRRMGWSVLLVCCQMSAVMLLSDCFQTSL